VPWGDAVSKNLENLRSIVVSCWPNHQEEFMRETLDQKCPESLKYRPPLFEAYIAIAVYLFRQKYNVAKEATITISAAWW